MAAAEAVAPGAVAAVPEAAAEALEEVAAVPEEEAVALAAVAGEATRLPRPAG